MTQTPVTAPSTQDPPQRLLSGKKRVLASAFAGTTIEWYDFYLYGTAAALIFNVQFFPSNSELGSLLASFATLAVGFFARPLGGIVAGHLGDRVGRKALLVVSLLCMGTASTLIGLVPNFDAIGWWAAVSSSSCASHRGCRPEPNGADRLCCRSNTHPPASAVSSDPSRRSDPQRECCWPPAPSSSSRAL